MSFCKKPKNINQDNQNLLDSYLFGNRYNPNDVTINSKGDRCEIHIGNRGEKNNSNPNYYLFSSSNTLGSGSYGTVLKYVDANKRVALAVKFTSDNEEEEISNALNNSNCHILKMRQSGKNWSLSTAISKYSRFSYFMELADGDLFGFLMDEAIKPELKNHPKIFLDIAETIRVQLLCLFNLNKNYVYTDIKLGNILYKCDENNNVHFMLGDLGSAVQSAAGDYAATYPPVNFGRGLFKLKTLLEKESTLSWQMGILLISLFPFYMFSTNAQILKYRSDKSDKLTWGRITTVTSADIDKFQVNLDQLEHGLFSETGLKSPKTNLFRSYIDNNLELRATAIYTSILGGEPDMINRPVPEPIYVSPHRVSPQQPNAQQVAKLQKLKNLTVVKLREIAKSLGCIGYSKMKKADLIFFLFNYSKNQGRPQAVGRPPVVVRSPVVAGRKPQISNLSKLTVVKLRELAKKSGCKGYSKLLKAQLIKFIAEC
jgi:serine/threonine protein kinase